MIEQVKQINISIVATYFKDNMDFCLLHKLGLALGTQLNERTLRFLKSMFIEFSFEEYSNNTVKRVNEKGCDLIIPALNNARVELKYTEDALYTPVKHQLRKSTGAVKLMNSMGENIHKTLPDTYADYLMVIGLHGAILFDKETIEQYITVAGDGISANIPTNLGIILATPLEMKGNQSEIDMLNELETSIRSYIKKVKTLHDNTQYI